MLNPGRHARPSRKVWLIIGGAALLVFFAAGAWQAGLFKRRTAPVPSPPPLTERGTSGRPLETSSEETKLKLQIAEAERAKAEADLARSRTDAEVAKQRAAALRAERKDAVPAPLPRVATAEPPKPPANAPPPSSPAPATTPIPGPQAAPPVSPPAAQPAPPPATPAAGVSTVAPPAPAPLVAPSLTDSDRGVALQTCEAFEDVRAFSYAHPVRVLNGAIVVEHGHPGKPGYLFISGRPSPDGHLVLSGIVLALASRYRGQQARVRYEGTYRDGRYELAGMHGTTRRCTMTIRMGSQP